MKIFLIALLLLFTMLFIFSTQIFADRCIRSLKGMQGYTIVSVTQVDGEFEGCDFGRIIRFLDGTILKCNSYNYTYSYMPDAIIFANPTTFQGKTFAIIKVLIEGEIFEMESIVLPK